MKFVVTIQQDEDGVYIADCPSIPGCVSQGNTEAEAETNIAGAIRDCLAVRSELGLPLTVAIREVEVAATGPCSNVPSKWMTSPRSSSVKSRPRSLSSGRLGSHHS